MGPRRIIALSLALVLGSLSARAQHYDRGYDMSSSPVFARKDCFMIGGNARFSWHEMSDHEILVFDGINSSGYSIAASPSFLYMIRDNIGVGATFSYDRRLLDLKSAGLSVSEISMSLEDYYRVSQSFGAAAIFRPYIPLGRSGRFSMFAEARFGGSIGRIKNTAEVSAAVKGTYTEKYKLYVSVNPGFSIFICNHLAMELSLGILGISYNWNKQVHNQVATGSSDSANASFMVNPASIAVGFAYYL